jgi:hypothetical protein
MTSDMEWDPSQYDKDLDNVATFYDPSEEDLEEQNFDQYGEYRHRTVATHHTCCEEELYDNVNSSIMKDDLLVTVHPETVSDIYGIHSSEISKVVPNFDLLHPLFDWAPADTIKRTFGVTTQYARGRVSDSLKQHWRSRCPACNVKRRNEPVATDTIFSDTPAVDCGVTAAQIFVGRETLVADVYGLKTDKEFVNTLEENIRERGAMSKLTSDCAKRKWVNE